MSTKKDILNLLRLQPLTVAELADKLNLTRTAITTQLHKLVSEKLVMKTKIRRSTSAGKPAQEYMLSPEAQDASSKVYRPFVLSIIELMEDTLSREDLSKFLSNAGRIMAENASLKPGPTSKRSVENAIHYLDELNAPPELEEKDGKYFIRYVANSPLATAIAKNPKVTDVLAAFFEEATGLNVTQDNDFGEYISCTYILES